MEEEIDLRQYVAVIVRYWKWIVGIALVAALTAGVVSFLLPPTYEATAGVVIVKSKMDITFDPKMKTLTEEDLAVAGARQTVDLQARRETFAGLVQNGAIAAQVIEELGDELEEEEKEPARLLEMVEGEVKANSDLIQIKVKTNDPLKAANVANAWARAYEQRVNTVYGETPKSYSSVQSELAEAKKEYEATQKALTTFIAEKDRTAELERLIAEKQTVLSELQSGKQSAIAAVIGEEIDMRRQIISAYLQAQASNRLLAFNKGQEAKRQVLSELIDAEIANRLAALRRDRDIRLKLFNSYVDAEIKSKLAVFNQQVDEKLGDLAQAYARKDKLDRLLRDARSLRAQVAEGGATSSNHLALTLLKAQAFASSASLPGELQVQVPAAGGESQLADVDALVGALERERSQVEEEIQTLSKSLLGGEGYQFLDALSAASLSVSTPLTVSLALASSEPLSATATLTGSLASYIDQRYAELFDLGEMARSAEQVTGNTPLFEEFEKLYPDLFEPDALMRLAETVPPETTLREEAQQRAKELLQLEGMETILGFTVESEPITRKIAELQRKVRELRAEQETLRGQMQELTRARDLAWETYTTLARKEAELGIAAQTGGTEVRFAVPAAVPNHPIAPKKRMNVAIAGALGLFVGVFGAFAANYLSEEEEKAVG